MQRTDPEWEGAIPFEKIPGPSRYSLIRDFLPGGEQSNGETFKSITININRNFYL